MTTPDADRLAALHEAVEKFLYDLGGAEEPHVFNARRARLYDIASIAAGVTLHPAAPAEGLTCPHGAEWDGRIWTKVRPATPAEGPHGEHNDVTPWECVCVDCWEPAAPAEGLREAAEKAAGVLGWCGEIYGHGGCSETGVALRAALEEPT